MPFASVIRWWLRRAQREIHMKCVLRQDVISHFRWIRFSHHDVFVCPSAITFYSLCPFVRCFWTIASENEMLKASCDRLVTNSSQCHTTITVALQQWRWKEDAYTVNPFFSLVFGLWRHVTSDNCSAYDESIMCVCVNGDSWMQSRQSTHMVKWRAYYCIFIRPSYRWCRAHGTFISNWSDQKLLIAVSTIRSQSLLTVDSNASILPSIIHPLITTCFHMHHIRSHSLCLTLSCVSLPQTHNHHCCAPRKMEYLFWL